MSGQIRKQSIFESTVVLNQRTYFSGRELQHHWGHALVLHLDLESFGSGIDGHFCVRAKVKQHELPQPVQESPPSLSGIHFAPQYRRSKH
jgi:hypothetical protein